MSAPSCAQAEVEREYTRAWPELVPAPSLYGAPVASVRPSAERETREPLWSFKASPKMVAPCWRQKVEDSSSWRDETALLSPDD
eukprot:scaffold214730_cov31-Tisochrysis_lutea.AAC.2